MLEAGFTQSQYENIDSNTTIIPGEEVEPTLSIWGGILGLVEDMDKDSKSVDVSYKNLVFCSFKKCKRTLISYQYTNYYFSITKLHLIIYLLKINVFTTCLRDKIIPTHTAFIDLMLYGLS